MVKLITIGFLFFINLISQNEWETVLHKDSLNIPLGIPCSIEVLNDSTCFMLTTLGSPNKIFKTINQGKNWFLLTDSFPNVQFAKFMNCPNDSFIVVSFDYGKLYKSTNAGISFEYIDFEEFSHTRNMAFFSNDLGQMNGRNIIRNNFKDVESYSLESKSNFYNLNRITFINDSTMTAIYVGWNTNRVFDLTFDESSFLYFNINTKEFDLHRISDKSSMIEYSRIGDTIIACGATNNISGGSNHDIIYKSIDGGITWKNILDLYSSRFKIPNQHPFGIQDIAFKNDSVGITVGQFGKILYTYDGGNSWIYEQKLPQNIIDREPPTLKVKYIGNIPIIATYDGIILRIVKDNLAPKPEDTLTIYGKVTLNGKGYGGVPVVINDYRVTMTDKNGNYHLGLLPRGTYTVKAINKYHDEGPIEEFYYKPFDFFPEHQIELTTDTSEINIEMNDLRTFFNISGSVLNENKGLENIPIELIYSGHFRYKERDTIYTNEEGFYIFEHKENFKYRVLPLSKDYTFVPDTILFELNQNFTSMDFIASPITTVKSNPNFQIRDNVLFSEEVAGMNYRIISLSGRVVKSAQLPKELNLNAHPTGTYILQITKSEQVIFTHKFQVVR